MLQSLLSQLIVGTSLVVCLAALIFGSARERIGAFYYLAAMSISVILGKIGWQTLHLRYIVADGFCLIGFLSLCWKSPHPWPLWATGLQMITVMAEVFSITHTNLLPWTLLTVINGCAYLILLALFVGTLAAMRARRLARQKSHN